ncbi:MAG: iron export ABC transporter permease subunit FetB [Hyphomicrobiales bacterium]|nr:iron export ABC transporter permease subunit FetB [Hyphomicrobiales bacterium]MCP5373373.1 iron export ABC transporter permease subunit FetB [Hyphomicrobiales bacterium]
MNGPAGFVALDYWDLAAAALLVALNALLSLVLRLNLERAMVIAAARMVAQLLLVGLVLRYLFSIQSLWLTGPVALVMVIVAGYEIRRRQGRVFTGPWTFALGGASIMVAGTLATLLALTTQIQPDPWYDARFALPLLGMILGNAMNGVSIGLDRLVSLAVRDRAAIEARLTLGHTFADAIRPVAREAFRGGLTHSINAMSAAGIVFLPGMMTGQILAGADPLEAVKYQILIMFLIAGATGIGVLLALSLGTLRLTDGRHRLRLDRLRPAEGD